MAENARPPVAVRIVRPYETEEAFLENELETVGKTSVILIGAHSRPTGVILRFEVVLASGVTVLRGEGRVLAHKESAFRGQPGLALRFTRLDPKSKALVDRAAAIREARLAGDSTRPAGPVAPASPSSAPSISVSFPPQISGSARPSPRSLRPSAPASSRASSPPDPGLAQILTSPTPPPPALHADGDDAHRSTAPNRRSERPTRAPEPADGRELDAASPAPDAGEDEARPSTLVDDAEARAGEAARAAASTSGEPAAASTSDAPPRPQAVTSLPMPPLPSIPPSVPPSAPASVAPGASEGDGAHAVSRPADRDTLLSRLRQRAASLTEEQMAAILRRPG